MATDALVAIQASVTKTATFQGAAFDFLTRPPFLLNLAVRVLYSAATNATGANSVTFTVEGSTDGTNWTTIGGARFSDIVNLSTTAQSGEIFIPVQGFSNKIRLVATFAGAGTVPTITYQGDLVMGMPA